MVPSTDRKTLTGLTYYPNAGTVKFVQGATTYTGPGGTAASVGFDDLTTSYQQIFTATGAGSYSANDWTIQAKANAAYGSATVVTFKANSTMTTRHKLVTTLVAV